jgi:hypothetical protein
VLAELGGHIWRPIGDAVARALAEGYSIGKPGFHGYYFKILKGQGRRRL